MTKKIKNYVDVLFSDIPNNRKAQELKEEILGNLSEHYEAHIQEGMSENQAYTECIKDLGDVDELLSAISPDREIKKDIDAYRKRRARNISLAVMLYITGAIFMIALPAIGSITNIYRDDLGGIIGFILLLVFAACATILIIYTNMSVSQNVADYITKNDRRRIPRTSNKVLDSIMMAYWPVVVALYLSISFATLGWAITWVIFPIAVAVRNVIYAIADKDEEEEK